MCGIAGFISRSFLSGDELIGIGKSMAKSLEHRGPDGSGEWIDERCSLVLSHRRLAVQDISEAGSQPMQSRNSRFVIAYNGEIYNTDELRKDLVAAGVVFRGHSDTEVILEAVSQWGVEKTVVRLNGIFAFAIWDRDTKLLSLARDRIGIKPLFWGWVRGGFAFGSELKALRAIPQSQFAINEEALAAYTLLNYVPTPQSIYQGVYKLRPGTILEITTGLEAKAKPYATLDQVVLKARANPFVGTEVDAVNQLAEILKRVVKRQLVADVPVGAFLSGGVDSSSIVAAIRATGSTVRTFTIKSTEAHYDESGYARAVANALGSEHEEYVVSPDEILSIIPQLADLADEPFGDASIVPTYFVSRAARSKVTVALSGDGGDELFSGYRRYMLAPLIWRRAQLLPQRLRHSVANLLRAVPAHAWDSFFSALPGPLRAAYGGIKMYKAASILDGRDKFDVFLRLISNWPVAPMRQRCGSAFIAFEHTFDPALKLSFPDQMQLLDGYTYLPDNNLAKVDRASMGVSLEVRVPLLDNEVVDFAWSLPEHFKRQGSTGKVILKRYLERHVPKTFIDRPKMGFGVPIDMWLRGPLRDWAEDLLDEKRLEADGLLDAKQIRADWNAHLSGRFNRAQSLWCILMFQAWKRRWL